MQQIESQVNEVPVPIVPMILTEMYAESMKGRINLPMAALCKRLSLRMSTLQRHLTALAEYDLVEVHCDDAGRWTTRLTHSGIAIFTEMAA